MPSPSSSPRRPAFPFDDAKFADIAYYAKRTHLSDLAEPERAFLQQWQEEYPDLDPRTAFDISGDPTSERFAILADAARTGHRSGQYVAPVVKNVQGHFERAMHPLMDEIQDSKEMLALDQAAIADADNLIAALEDTAVYL